MPSRLAAWEGDRTVKRCGLDDQETSAAWLAQGVLLLKRGVIVEKSADIENNAVFGFLPAHAPGFKRRFGG